MNKKIEIEGFEKIAMELSISQSAAKGGDLGWLNENQIAKKLMDAGNACGWDCAKYQKRNPDVCVPEKQKGVMRNTPWGRMKYIDYKYKIEFEKSEYDEIDVYCKNKPIEWTVSVWDLESLNFIANYEVPFLKIPSALLTDTELLAETAKSGNQVIISTGMSTLSEVDAAVNIVEKYGQKPVVLHCHSSCPAPHDELNLSIIPFIKKDMTAFWVIQVMKMIESDLLL